MPVNNKYDSLVIDDDVRNFFEKCFKPNSESTTSFVPVNVLDDTKNEQLYQGKKSVQK